MLTVKAPLGVLAQRQRPGQRSADGRARPGLPLPGQGSLAVNTDGSFTHTPSRQLQRSVQFSYKANDGTLDSAPATVTITVNPVNDAPVATDDAATTAEDTAIAIAVLANDSDVGYRSDRERGASVTPGTERFGVDHHDRRGRRQGALHAERRTSTAPTRSPTW